MTVFAYYTPFVASPVNDRRAGTYRVGSDSPRPIQIYKGWDAVLNFAFRDHTQRPYLTNGRTITARMFNGENVEIYSATLVSNILTDGAASLVLSSQVTNTLVPDLYSMVLEIEDEFGRKMLAQSSSRSLPRFVVEVIDQTTVSLND